MPVKPHEHKQTRKEPDAIPDFGKPRQPARRVVGGSEKPGEGAIDEGIEESFPASDPVSVNVTKVVKKPGENSTGERKAGEDSGKR